MSTDSGSDFKNPYPLVAPTRGNKPENDPSLLEAFRKAPVPDIADHVGPMYVMDAGLQPLYRPVPKMVGYAFTVKTPPGDPWATLAALGAVTKDDVLVVDWRGFMGGCAGGAGVLRTAHELGFAGMVHDGAWRDVDEIQEVQVPVFARGLNAALAEIRFLNPGDWNVAVSVGGVVVHPGDIVVGDNEGIVVVPRRFAADVAAAIEGRYARGVRPEPEWHSKERLAITQGWAAGRRAQLDEFFG